MSVPIDEPHSGMMLLLATHERSSPPDAGLAVAIGRLANAAIRNAALFTRARRQGEQLSELAGLGGLLLDGGDVAESLGNVVKRLQEITGYDMITLDTSDPSGEQPFIRAVSGRAFGGGPMDPDVERLWLTIKPLCHHERWDGTGYPNGLAGEEIPLAARVVSVADVYDALTSARPYKSAWPLERALVELMRMRGKTLCPTAVDVFMELWRDGEIGRIDAETEDEGLPFDFRDLAAA